MKLNCLLVDDEPLALELLEDNISRVPFLQLAGSCRNAMDAMTVLQNNAVDLVFSDIQMPGLSGLEFIRTLKNRPMFIFITAYEQYAIEGFNADVVDYLLKPVSYERFLTACNKAYELFSLRQAAARNLTAASADKSFLFVPIDYKMVKVELDTVSYLEAVKDYVRIHYQQPQQPPLLVRITMKAMQDQLAGANFIRIHKSFIVQVRCISAIRKNSVFIGELELPVGEQYKEDVARLVNGGL